MSTLLKAAQQALEAMQTNAYAVANEAPHRDVMAYYEAIAALADALEQSELESDRWGAGYEAGYAAGMAERLEQEPYAWMSIGGSIWRHKTTEDDVPLYTRPYRREWRGLTEEEIIDGREQLPTEDLCGWSFRQGVEFAEAALKERNA